MGPKLCENVMVEHGGWEQLIPTFNSPTSYSLTVGINLYWMINSVNKVPFIILVSTLQIKK